MNILKQSWSMPRLTLNNPYYCKWLCEKQYYLLIISVFNMNFSSWQFKLISHHIHHGRENGSFFLQHCFAQLINTEGCTFTSPFISLCSVHFIFCWVHDYHTFSPHFSHFSAFLKSRTQNFIQCCWISFV